jgi:mono/diheme cytochrome c family protein
MSGPRPRRSQRLLPSYGLLGLIMALMPSFQACAPQANPEPEVDPAVAEARTRVGPTPPDLLAGEEAYLRDCARCHGEDGLGSLSGPPLLHRIYQPTHHSDAAFLLSVRVGVRAHHWTYGDMDPMPAVSAEVVGEITSYVRWLQREVGIY